MAFPILWNNERKQVRMAALITKARKLCVESVEPKQPLEENNFKLVHVSGISQNE